MKELTERQKEVFSFIETFLAEHHYPPTVREIAGNFEISVKGAYDHLKALERKGMLKSGENRSRAMEVISRREIEPVPEATVAIPVLGVVAAGKPIFAEENYETSIQVPSYLVSGTCFALRVRGDSMRDAGIMNGDIAIIEQRQTAENGEIVVALVEDSVTLKRFFKEKNRVRLQAENPAYPPMYCQDVRVLGRLKSLFRTY